MYTPVDSRVWNDEKFIQFSSTAKLLFIYLLTSPHRNILGLYYLPHGYVVEDLRLPDEQLSAAWVELVDSGRIVYDELARVIFIPNFLRYNPIKGEKSIKGAANKFAEIPKTALAVQLAEVLSKQSDTPEIMTLVVAIQRSISGEDTPYNAPSMPHSKPHGRTVTVTVPVEVTESSISMPASGDAPTRTPTKKFMVPTLEEIRAYCAERENTVDPQRFYDYFNAYGWIDSKGNKVKNWKQKIITWESRESGVGISGTQSKSGTSTTKNYDEDF